MHFNFVNKDLSFLAKFQINKREFYVRVIERKINSLLVKRFFNEQHQNKHRIRSILFIFGIFYDLSATAQDPYYFRVSKKDDQEINMKEFFKSMNNYFDGYGFDLKVLRQPKSGYFKDIFTKDLECKQTNLSLSSPSEAKQNLD